ncbi:N-acetyltransferase [Desulfosporosinus hippei]|uniref:YoaP-like n=1 Tax=Desulfosporosinus hippei DSM 8344 TaxID=1121419 RepID=A0A1G8HR50_9FIRM|nr:YoaP domain-containing protein [Desulfosporosinus hippei]SDI09084.1 YoaP-like [Desulfosporosinus hippei DSM 8344]
MNIITISHENLDKEHICCAISTNTDSQVSSKKAWMAERFADGLVFKKGDVRGKVFIEYIPAEKAWCPIEAPGYMFINCLWVSGQFKGRGVSNKLITECINDSKSKGKKGLVALSSKKKMPFISDPKYLKYKGFLLADTAQPYYELMYLPFEENYEKPCFKSCVKSAKIEEQGFVLFYSNQCPFTEKYVWLIAEIAERKGIGFRVIKHENTEQAQNAPSPFTTYSLFYNGNFVTNEILSDKKFEKLLSNLGVI